MKKILFVIMIMVSVNTFGQEKQLEDWQRKALEGLTFSFEKSEPKRIKDFKRIDFKRNYTIDDYSKDKLDILIKRNYYDKDTIYIESHLSVLSEKKENIIKDYLIKSGVDSTMIKTVAAEDYTKEALYSTIVYLK